MRRRLHRLLALSALCIGLFFNTPSAWAQCPTPSTPANQVGGFELDRYRICVGQTVSVTNTVSGLISTGYNFNYDNKPLTSDLPLITTSPVYSQPGTYTILQASSGPKLACRTIEVVSTSATIGFTVQACTGTASLSYTITDDAAKYDRIRVLWGDGGQDDFTLNKNGGTIPPHIYQTKNRSYTITIFGFYVGLNCTGKPSTQSVYVGSGGGVLPVIKTLTSSDTQIVLEYQDPQGTSSSTLELLRKDQSGSYTSAGALPNAVGSTTVSATSDKITCFKLVARDGCGNERTSSEVCSLKLNAQSADKEVNLTWAYTVPATATIRRHEILRSNAPIFSGSYGALSYPDRNNIECGKQYCYRQHVQIDNGTTTTSNTDVYSTSVCVIGTDASTTAGPTAAFVSVNSGGGVDVVASLSLATTNPAPYTLIVARSGSPNGPFTNIAALDNARTYADQSVQTSSQSYCYQTAILNQCGTRSDFTKPACTVLLQAGSDGKTLQWTGDSPFFPDGQPIKYTIVPVSGATGGTLSPIDPPASATSYRIDASNQSTRFYIAAYDNAGVLVSYSNTIDIQLSPSLLIPDAFTPNGDGLNNAFMPKGLFWETLDMTVYDRWGGVVFNTTDKDSTGWDGTINGAHAPAGYYAYRIRITDASGRAFERAGRVLLLR